VRGNERVSEHACTLARSRARMARTERARSRLRKPACEKQPMASRGGSRWGHPRGSLATNQRDYRRRISSWFPARCAAFAFAPERDRLREKSESARERETERERERERERGRVRRVPRIRGNERRSERRLAIAE